MTYAKYALGIVGALGLLAAGQSARALTLADVESSSGSLTFGGITYSDFNVGGTLNASDVTVVFTNSGVEFMANWNTLTPGADSSVIAYTITSNTGEAFDGSSLFFAGQVSVNGGTASVGETLTDVSTGANYSMQVYYAGKGDASNALTDSVTIDPSATSLRVVKSIDVSAAAGAFASLNFVENTYTQSPSSGATPPVPEPMSLALLPLGLVGLGLRKKFAR